MGIIRDSSRWSITTIIATNKVLVVVNCVKIIVSIEGGVGVVA